MSKRQVSMDIMCELASDITEYIWYQNKPDRLEHHSYEAPNGDIMYTDEAQDIFNQVLDIIDDNLNGVDAPSIGE